MTIDQVVQLLESEIRSCWDEREQNFGLCNKPIAQRLTKIKNIILSWDNDGKV